MKNIKKYIILLVLIALVSLTSSCSPARDFFDDEDTDKKEAKDEDEDNDEDKDEDEDKDKEDEEDQSVKAGSNSKIAPKDNNKKNSNTATSKNKGTFDDPVELGSSFSWFDESLSTSFGYESDVTMSVTGVKKLSSADITALGFDITEDLQLEYVLVSLNIICKNVTPTELEDPDIYYSNTQPSIWGSETPTGRSVIGGTDYGFDGSISRNLSDRYPSGSNTINKGSSASEINFSGDVLLPVFIGETNYLVMQKANHELEYDAQKIHFKLN